MDQRAESPSWLSGASPVATGADPPDQEPAAEDEHDNGQAYAAESVPAPSFGDGRPGDFGNPFGDGEYGDGSAQADGSAGGSGVPEVTRVPGQFGDAPAADGGFGDAPQPAPGFGETPGPDAFAPPAPAFGGPAETSQGFGDYSAAAPRFGDAPPAGQFNEPPLADPFGDGPVTGMIYPVGQAGTGYPPVQENGAPTREAGPTPYPAHYPPHPPPPQSTKARLTASLKAARRVKSDKGSRPGRQAQLTVSRLEPWSVMKFSFVISLVAFIVLFVAVAILYAVLSSLGVFDALQRTIESITSSQSSSGFNVQTYLSASRVLGYTGLLGALNVVLITALSTVGAVLYNITADLAGGVEVTLKETD